MTLSPTSGSPTSVNYTTSTVPPANRPTTRPPAGTLNFAANDPTETISVPMKGDLLDEDNEIVNVDLSGASGAPISDDHADLTIVDDDVPPTISIADASKGEGDSGQSNADFTASLSAASGKTVSVGYSTGDGRRSRPRTTRTPPGR